MIHPLHLAERLYIRQNQKNRIALITAFLFLLIGGFIYVCFRSKDIHLYKFMQFIGFSGPIDSLRSYHLSLPPWVIYSLPDALWISAYLLTLNAIWKYKNTPVYKILAYTMPAIAICTEFLQTFDWFHGTFDKIDLLCYIIPTILFTPLRYEI